MTSEAKKLKLAKKLKDLGIEFPADASAEELEKLLVEAKEKAEADKKAAEKKDGEESEEDEDDGEDLGTSEAKKLVKIESKGAFTLYEIGGVFEIHNKCDQVIEKGMTESAGKKLLYDLNR